MITDSDIRKMKQVFVTKEDLKKELRTYATKKDLKSTENFLNYRIDTLERKVDDFKNEFIDFKERVLKTLDWLVGAFKKFDEELTISNHRSIDFWDKLENHEIRIKNIERNPVFQ